MAIELRNKLVAKGLKVTPQRLVILEAIIQLHNHPTAEHILENRLADGAVFNQ